MASTHNAGEILEEQKVLGTFKYNPKPSIRGYTGEILRVDISEPSFRIIPVTEKMKETFTGGKGFDLWMMWQEVTSETKWNSPENPICIAAGPLGGTPSFSGSGKSIVTTISPTTGSAVDSNVGGHFGPLLKFSGFDCLVITGKSENEVIVFIDGMNGKVQVIESPLLSVNSHLAAEELAEMYSDNDDDKRHISTVSSGIGADHAWIGCLNFSWWDWRRKAMRLKQAG
ncbi:MAG: aldehyde:ferredoxin oxidoreductase, partial [Candidatus Aegiribacteria sp.]|nr:aldehyde:ferredoxin oxidoreductase [Candidatus Aegiribacteria sp.]